MLAVLLPERSAVTPDVQTMAEAGMPGVSVPTWQAIFAPAKTPGEIIDRVSREVNLVLQRPEVRAQFERQTFLVIGSAPQALAATIKDDIQTWRRFTVENGIVPE
jgi:tripartite-type tricarboxylate transporter receptor subunit TctC